MIKNVRIVLITNVLLSVLYVIYAFYYKYQVDNSYIFIHHNPSILTYTLDYIYARYFLLICATQLLLIFIAITFYNYKFFPTGINAIVPVILGSWAYLMTTPGNILYQEIDGYWITIGFINIALSIWILFTAKQKPIIKETSILDDDMVGF